MFVRFHLLELAAAPAAKLFAIRHVQGHLVRDGDGAVIIGSDKDELDKRRRALNVATVAHVAALVPESDVREGEGAPLVPDALVGPLAAFLNVATVALARYVSPPTLDDLRVLAYDMGFELTPRVRTAPTAEAMEALAETIAERIAARSAEAQIAPVQEEPLPDAPTNAELELAAQVEAPMHALTPPEGVADQTGPLVAIEVAEGETATLSVPPKKKRKS